MKNLIRRLTLASVVLASASIGTRLYAGPSITPVVTYTSTGTGFDSRPFTLGYQFTLSSTEDVNALGYWVDGNNDDHSVGIWDSSGNLLASTTVLSTDPVVDNFAWDAVSLILGPGSYTIGGELNQTNGESGNYFPINPTGISTIPGFTWVTDVQLYGTGLNDPTYSTGGGYGNNGILSVDFSVGGGNNVPDGASTLGLLGGAIAVLGAVRRRFARS